MRKPNGELIRGTQNTFEMGMIADSSGDGKMKMNGRWSVM